MQKTSVDVKTPVGPVIDIKDCTYKHMTKQQFITQIVDKYPQYIKYDEKSNKLSPLGHNFINSAGVLQDTDKKAIQLVDFDWKPPQLKVSLIDQITANSEGKVIEPGIISYPLLLPLIIAEIKAEVKYNHVYLGFVSDSVLYPESPFEIEMPYSNVNNVMTITKFNTINQGKMYKIPMSLLFSYDLPNGIYKYTLADMVTKVTAIFYGGACQGMIINNNMQAIIVNNNIPDTVFTYLNGEIVQSADLINLGKAITTYSNRISSSVTILTNNIVTLSFKLDATLEFHGEAVHETKEYIEHLTYDHGYLRGPFTIVNNNPQNTYTLVGTMWSDLKINILNFANFIRPWVIDLNEAIPYTIGKLVYIGKKVYPNKTVETYHEINLNELHQRNGKVIIKSNTVPVELIANRGLGIIIIDNGKATLTRSYINGVEYSSTDYEQQLLTLKEGLTVVLGRDIPGIVGNYLI